MSLSIPDRAQLLDLCRGIAEDYYSRGRSITLRQLYYQGVVRRYWPNGQHAYDRIKTVLSAARLKGEFPLHLLTDRSRDVRLGEATRNDCSIDRALGRAAQAVLDLPDTLLVRDRWFGQETHVSVWFEKDALTGIFGPTCRDLGVSWLACKGDPSHSILFEWMRETLPALGVDNAGGWRDRHDNAHKGLAQRAVVLYFGDHDPTGMRIPQTAESTLRTFLDLSNVAINLTFERIGITLEQAHDLGVPPFPAKQTSADYKRYVEEYETTDAWELDAIPPDMLVEMIEDAVNAYFDAVLHTKLQHDISKRRDAMRQRMRTPAWKDAATTWED